MAPLNPITRNKLTVLAEALRNGLTINPACAKAGIGRTTYYRHMQEGKRLEEQQPEGYQEDDSYIFFVEVEKALADFVEIQLATIQREGFNGKWQAAAWMLERRFPDQFALQSRHQIVGSDGGPVQHEHEHKHKHVHASIHVMMDNLTREQLDTISQELMLPESEDVSTYAESVQ